MPTDSEGRRRIVYCVGEERALRDVLPEPEAAALLADTLTAMAHNNLKRMLTTETHTEVVNRSYEELVQTNRSLSASEQRYRDLAETLEIKVRERTEELSRAMARLVQQEKMAFVGQPAAGGAHETNDPHALLTSNLRTLKKYTERFLDMIARYHRVCEQGGGAQRDRDDL